MSNYNEKDVRIENFAAAWAQLRKALRDLDLAATAVERTMAAVLPGGKPEKRKSKLDLITQMLADRPGMDILQLVDSLRNAGYGFYGRDPVGATRALLYSRKDLIHAEDGKFSLVLKGKTHVAAG